MVGVGVRGGVHEVEYEPPLLHIHVGIIYRVGVKVKNRASRVGRRIGIGLGTGLGLGLGLGEGVGLGLRLQRGSRSGIGYTLGLRLGLG